MLTSSLAVPSAAHAGKTKPTAEERQVRAPDTGTISYQGRLEEHGAPVTGTRSMTLQLFSDSSCTTPVDAATTLPDVSVTDGLFTVELTEDLASFDGGERWLRISVEGVPVSCHKLLAAPFALSAFGFPAGTTVSGDATDWDGLHVENAATTGSSYGVFGASDSNNGRGVNGVANSNFGATRGVSGTSHSIEGYGGYFENTNNGTAVYADGKLASSAQTHLWISGNGVVPHVSTPNVVILADSTGAAYLTRGPSTGTKYVVLPITVPGVLFGQRVTVSRLEIFWAAETASEVSPSFLLRRQDGACGTSSCYDTILHISANRACDPATYPTGCKIQYGLDTNNTLNASSGILYLAIGFEFANDSNWIRLGGARLTLDHE
jgi:hypothetical protein